VLRLVGMSLSRTIKGQDITARYGGEEFAVVLPTPRCAGADGRRSHPPRGDGEGIEEEIDRRILGRVTISVGVSMLKPGDDTDSLIERADACLTPPSATAATA